jgi:oxygen-independent coproporphyrinogen-3 oxidase
MRYDDRKGNRVIIRSPMDHTTNHPPPPWIWPRSAYIHVPFCAHHCGYCDFAVAVGHDDRIDAYIHALTAELARLGTPQPVRTLFIGGGTPTHLGPRQLDVLLPAIAAWLPLERGGEFSIEANPAGLDDAKLRVLAGHGVNRVSLGAQSFDADLLHVLERDHQPADVPRAVEGIRRHIDNVALDLIFGVPGQSLAQWRTDLDRALALEPTHISTYGLTYEKGTRLWKQRRAGQLRPLDEEAELAMYTTALDRLAETGFAQYEISNHARPGFECRHNLTYWANEAHFGIGMGAAGYVRGMRRLNTRDLHGYIRRALAGEPTHFQSEELPPRERAAETAVVQLRRCAGIERAAFARQTGFALDALLGPTLHQLGELGLLSVDGSRVALTRQGRCVADAIIAEMLKALDATDDSPADGEPAHAIGESCGPPDGVAR